MYLRFVGKLFLVFNHLLMIFNITTGLLIFASWSAAINNISNVFIGANMKHVCDVPSDQTFYMNNTSSNESYVVHYVPG